MSILPNWNKEIPQIYKDILPGLLSLGIFITLLCLYLCFILCECVCLVVYEFYSVPHYSCYTLLHVFFLFVFIIRTWQIVVVLEEKEHLKYSHTLDPDLIVKEGITYEVKRFKLESFPDLLFRSNSHFID